MLQYRTFRTVILGQHTSNSESMQREASCNRILSLQHLSRTHLFLGTLLDHISNTSALLQGGSVINDPIRHRNHLKSLVLLHHYSNLYIAAHSIQATIHGQHSLHAAFPLHFTGGLLSHRMSFLGSCIKQSKDTHSFRHLVNPIFCYPETFASQAIFKPFFCLLPTAISFCQSKCNKKKMHV
jgi:hypothetical protein